MKRFFIVEHCIHAMAVLILFALPVIAHGKTVVIDVPYTSQAPEGNWSEPWQNACEETSIAMVNAFYLREPINSISAPGIILSVFNKKHEKLRESKDESFDDLATFIHTEYDWRVTERKYVESEDIEHEIDKHHPVFIAFDAREIPAAPFPEPKPDYHVAVIVGYDDVAKEFIFHDPGLSEGKEIRYTYEDVIKANQEYVIADTGEVRGGDVLFTAPPNFFITLLRRFFFLFDL